MPKYCLIFLLLFAACNSNNEQATVVENKKDTPVSFTVPKIESEPKTDTAFLIFWTKFTQILKTNNQKLFRSIAADSLDCGIDNGHGLTALDKFMANSYTKLFDTLLINRFADKDKITFYDAAFDAEYAPAYLLQQIKKGKEDIKEVDIEVSDTNDEPIVITLKFMETKNEFKFYGYNK